VSPITAATTPTDPVEMFRHVLRLFFEGDTESHVALLAEDVVFEFPFAPAGVPRRLEGKAAAAQHIRVNLVEPARLPEATIHRTTEPDTAIAEARNVGRVKATGARFDMSFIAVMKVRDGRITLYRDYWSPLDVGGLAGAEPAGEATA
jgi:ketosteroid isomerase-like protein